MEGDRIICSIHDMDGFPTENKIPKVPWRDTTNRWPVLDVLKEHNQVGIVPAEFGCVVIDIDIKGEVNGAKNLGKVIDLPPTTHYKTQSGGWHVWYRVPEGSVITQHHRVDGVDIRYADGYVCFNKDYKVTRLFYIREADGKLLEWLTKPREVRKFKAVTTSGAKGNYQYDLSPIPKGRRNNTLYSWGYGLLQGVRKGELSERDLNELIHLRGRMSGLPYFECEQIINSLLTSSKVG